MLRGLTGFHSTFVGRSAKSAKTAELFLDGPVFWRVAPYVVPIRAGIVIFRRCYDLQHPLGWVRTRRTRRSAVGFEIINKG